MIPRPSLAGVVVVGLLALLVGLIALHGVLAAEREDAIAGLELRRSAASRYAARDLVASLRQRAAEGRARIDAALADPLQRCPGCYHRQGGIQLLPRVWPAAPSPGRSARSYHDELVAGGAAAVTDATWIERVRLHAGCRTAPDRAVEAVIEHRARFALPVEQELGSALALLATCRPSTLRTSALLQGGFDVPGGRRIEGLERYVLRNLHHLGAADATFAAERVAAAGRAAGLRVDDFAARLREVDRAPLALPATVDGPTLVPADGASVVWYLEPVSGGVEGVAVELAPLLTGIASEMRTGVLLGAGDRIQLVSPAGGPIALTAARVEVLSPSAHAARIAIERRHLVKLGLLVMSGAMSVVIAGLGLTLQRRRRRMLEMKARFVADVSHELRTPLASMRVLAETLARRTNLDQVRDYPARLLRDIDGMSFLVDNILSFNRLTKGRWEPRRETLKLRELVERACQEAGEAAGRSVNATVLLGEVSFRADPELLGLLFRNLVANGVSYNRRDPIEIRAAGGLLPDRSLEIRIGDNGVGIAAEERERVFAEFYRGAHGSMARGSGLGLALCRRILSLHGGTIAIQSSGPDGTTFRLWFPRAPS